MQTYNFFCEKCNKYFSLQLSISEYARKGYRCPNCDGTKAVKKISSHNNGMNGKDGDPIGTNTEVSTGTDENLTTLKDLGTSEGDTFSTPDPTAA